MTNRREGGFTLVELLMVLLIIGLLISIVVPVYKGQRNKAKNTVAKTALRNAMTAARSYYFDNDTYSGITLADIRAQESSIPSTAAALTDTPGSSADPRELFITYGCGGGNNGCLVLCAASRGDASFCISDEPGLTGKTRYRLAINGSIQAAFSSTSYDYWWY